MVRSDIGGSLREEPLPGSLLVRADPGHRACLIGTPPVVRFLLTQAAKLPMFKTSTPAPSEKTSIVRASTGPGRFIRSNRRSSSNADWLQTHSGATRQRLGVVGQAGP